MFCYRKMDRYLWFFGEVLVKLHDQGRETRLERWVGRGWGRQEHRSAGRGSRRGRRGGRPQQRSTRRQTFLFHFYVLVGLKSGEGDGLLFLFLFNWTGKWALSMLVCIDLFCQLSVYRWVSPVRFGVNSLSIHDQCELQIITQKIVIFCDWNVKSWFFKI
jgi:hypothetical protein